MKQAQMMTMKARFPGPCRMWWEYQRESLHQKGDVNINNSIMQKTMLKCLILKS
jgi:hypothetical protein